MDTNVHVVDTDDRPDGYCHVLSDGGDSGVSAGDRTRWGLSHQESW